MGAQNIVKEMKQYKEKWLHHIQRMDTTKTSTTISTKRTRERRMTEEEMEGLTSS